MHLNYVIEGQHPNSRQHLLHAMRDLMLTGNYAPMNTDLFYDQFVDPGNLSSYGKNVLSLAKSAWSQEFKHFTHFVDYGLAEQPKKHLLAAMSMANSTVELRLLNCTSIAFNTSKLTRSIEDFEAACKDTPGLLNFPINNANAHMARNVLHEHLPAHFSTYHDTSLQKVMGQTPKVMQRAILESPFAGDIHLNTEYAARCIVELMLNHHKAPMASHLLYTRMLNDHVPEERQIGIDAGLEYGRHAQESIIAVDRGVSGGMRYGIKNAEAAGRALSFFTLSSVPQIKQDVASLRDAPDLEAWVAYRQSVVPAELQQAGWLTETPHFHAEHDQAAPPAQRLSR